jgi:formylglycine-generating enzyme required for sulfatase activity
MSAEEPQIQPKIQVDRGSIATNFEAGNIENSTIAVHNTINNFAKQESNKEFYLQATIPIEDFEPETILVPAGPFWLGSELGEGVKEYETPRHQVELPAYRISKYPVLNRQYQEFIFKNPTVKPPSGWSGRKAPEATKNEPVRGVTWEEARRYCEWLMERTDRKYALPNEAQLEKLYQGSFNSSDILEEISLWTSTLWGEYIVPPELKFRYPWKIDDGRNDVNAHNQMRRVVCRYRKLKDMDKWQRFSRTGQFPKKPFPPGGYSFRVVLNF